VDRRCSRHRRRWWKKISRAPSRGRLRRGLTFPRFFTEAGVDPFSEVEWEIRAATIGNERGEMVFEQRDVEIPKFWSQQATNIVVSKYFRGQIGTPERERSVKQLIGRVVTTITEWARTHKYFATEDDLQAFSDDLKHILVYQKAAFNSPVWFNCGFEKAPQCSPASSTRSRTRWTRS
jgi:ribonucleoside-diphosphate reductase alpha chain